MNKEIIILNSSLATFKNDNGKDSTYNKITFAYRGDRASDEIVGFDKVKTCYVDASSFELTKSIKPYELLDAVVDFKENQKGDFKIYIVEINGVSI